MSNKLTDDTVQIIAEQYCTNGRLKVKALEDAGYAPSYARSCGLAIYDNIRVINAIQAFQAKLEAKSGFTRLIAEQEYDGARTIAESKADASSMVSATRGKAKLYGLDITSIEVGPSQGHRPPDADKAIERSKRRAVENEAIT